MCRVASRMNNVFFFFFFSAAFYDPQYSFFPNSEMVSISHAHVREAIQSQITQLERYLIRGDGAFLIHPLAQSSSAAKRAYGSYHHLQLARK